MHHRYGLADLAELVNVFVSASTDTFDALEVPKVMFALALRVVSWHGRDLSGLDAGNGPVTLWSIWLLAGRCRRPMLA